MSNSTPHSAPEKSFVPLNISLLTVSDTRRLADDNSGQYLADEIVQNNHQLHDRQLCADNIYQIRAIVSQWIANDAIQVILITGGTGFYGRDNTPEALDCLFDKPIDGFGEMFRLLSKDEIGMATIQSRASAGLANRTAIFCLPGSPGACKTAWEGILRAQLDNRTRPCNFVPHLLKPEKE